LGINNKGEKFFFIVLPTGAKKLAFYDSKNSNKWFYHSNDTALDLVTPSDINMFTLIGQTFGSNDEKVFFDLPSYQNIYYYMNSTYIPNKIKQFTFKEIDERSDVFADTIKSKLYEYFPIIDIRRVVKRKKSSSNSSSSKSSSKSSSNSQTRRVVKRKKSSSKSSSNGSSTNSQTRKKQTKQRSRGGARKTRK